MKCNRCFWSEGGRCYHDALADIRKCEHGRLEGELFECNDDLLERCRLYNENKREIKRLRKEKAELEERIEDLEEKDFSPGKVKGKRKLP